MLAKITDVIEMVGLQVGARRADVGQGRLAENLGCDILDRAIRDFMDEADIPVFTRRDPGMTSRLVISGSTMASRPRRP
ncbi:hypothetical protein IVB22_30900 [Bradyrhizobium sp. 190]|nr:hypothetical protein [Bradyrhizobium sp. 190]